MTAVSNHAQDDLLPPTLDDRVVAQPPAAAALSTVSPMGTSGPATTLLSTPPPLSAPGALGAAPLPLSISPTGQNAAAAAAAMLMMNNFAPPPLSVVGAGAPAQVSSSSPSASPTGAAAAQPQLLQLQFPLQATSTTSTSGSPNGAMATAPQLDGLLAYPAPATASGANLATTPSGALQAPLPILPLPMLPIGGPVAPLAQTPSASAGGLAMAAAPFGLAGGARLQQAPASPTGALNLRNANVFVAGLPSSMSAEELRAIFAPYGDVVSLRLVSEKHYGFVQFRHPEAAERAIAGLHEAHLQGTRANSKLHVTLAMHNEGGDETPNNRLFVRHLPPYTTKDLLRDLFARYGAVTELSVITDQEGRCKGSGFVTFERLEEARAAHAMLNQGRVEFHPPRSPSGVTHPGDAPLVVTLTVRFSESANAHRERQARNRERINASSAPTLPPSIGGSSAGMLAGHARPSPLGAAGRQQQLGFVTQQPGGAHFVTSPTGASTAYMGVVHSGGPSSLAGTPAGGANARMYHAATTAFGAPTPTGQQHAQYATYPHQLLPTQPATVGATGHLGLAPLSNAAAPPALYGNAPQPQQQQQQQGNGLMLFMPSPTGAQSAAAPPGYAFPPPAPAPAPAQHQQHQQSGSPATTPAGSASMGVLFYPSAGDVRIILNAAAGAPPPSMQEADVRALVGASGVAAATDAMTIATGSGGAEAIVRLQRPGMGPAIAQALNGRWMGQHLLTVTVL